MNTQQLLALSQTLAAWSPLIPELEAMLQDAVTTVERIVTNIQSAKNGTIDQAVFDQMQSDDDAARAALVAAIAAAKAKEQQQPS